jgi:hypothetical protein
MDEAELNALCERIANRFIDCYGECSVLAPKPIILVGMTGALAALARTNGFERQKIIDALNSSFDDIEGKEPK